MQRRHDIGAIRQKPADTYTSETEKSYSKSIIQVSWVSALAREERIWRASPLDARQRFIGLGDPRRLR